MSKCPFEIDYETIATGDTAPLLARLRDEAPVTRVRADHALMEGCLITRREDVVKVAGDPATFSSSANPQGERFGEYNEAVADIYRARGWPLSPVLVWIDPPTHTRFRAAVDKVFAPSRVQERSGHIEACIDKAIAGFASDGRIEAIADYALKVPAMVMTREFGAPEDEYLRLIRTTEAVGGAVDFTRTPPDEIQAVVEAAAYAATEFQHYLLPHIERVRSQPEPIMLSELVHAKRGEEPAFTMQQLQSLLITFLIAATHSTTGALGWALYILAQRLDIQERLRREPEKIDAFNEEVLRTHGTVATSYRTTTREVELHGVVIPAGSQIFLRWDSANADPAYWADPARFDIDRRNGRSHNTFGYGIHFCVGNTLARREMLLTVQAFLRRYRLIELDSGAPAPEIFPSTNVHLLGNLPLRLHAHDSTAAGRR